MRIQSIACAWVLGAVSVACSDDRIPSEDWKPNTKLAQECLEGLDRNNYEFTATADTDTILKDRARLLSMGMAVSAGTSFVLDLNRGGLVPTNSEDSSAVVGATGNLATQFLPLGGVPRFSPRSRRVDWLASNSESFFVLDGRSLLRVPKARSSSHTVAYDINPAIAAPPPLFVSRIRAIADTVYFDVEYSFGRSSTSPDRTRRQLAIWRVTPTELVQVFEEPLPTLPEVKSGLVHHGSREAVMMWDLVGECIAVNNGADSIIRLIRPRTRERQSIAILTKLEADDRPSGDIVAAASVPDSIRLPEPSRLKKIRRLRTAPDGTIWLELMKNPGSLNELLVLKKHLSSGSEALEVTSFFPSHFEPDGSVYGLTSSAEGMLLLHRAGTRQEKK